MYPPAVDLSRDAGAGASFVCAGTLNFPRMLMSEMFVPRLIAVMPCLSIGMRGRLVHRHEGRTVATCAWVDELELVEMELVVRMQAIMGEACLPMLLWEGVRLRRLARAWCCKGKEE